MESDASEIILDLIQTIKALPNNIRDVMRAAPGSNQRGISGLIGGGAVGGIASSFVGLSPKLSLFSTEISRLVKNLTTANKSLESAQQFSSSSPLGNAGLENIKRSTLNPFVSPKDRQEVLSRVAEAKKQASRFESAKKAVDASRQNRNQASEDYRKSIDDYTKSQEAKKRIDQNAKRAFNAAYSLDRQYLQLQGLAQGQNATNYAPHLRAAKQRRDRAFALAKSLTSKGRKAGRSVIAARSRARSALGAFRAAHGNVGKAKAASRAAGMAARTAASSASAAAATATARAGMVAFGTAVSGATLLLGSFVKGIFDTKNAMNAFAENVNRGNRHLAHFSAGIAQAFTRLDLNENRRTFATARGTEQTTIRLANAIDKMRQDQLQGNIASRNLANTFAALGARGVGGFDKEIGRLTSQIERFVEASGIGEQGEGAEAIGSIVAKVITLGLPDILSAIGDFFGLKKAKDADNFAPVMGPGDQFAADMAKRAANAGPIFGNRRKPNAGQKGM